MNFNFREHAWMAPIGNFLVGTLALGVAVIINRERLKEFLGRYWKFIAAIFGAAALWALYLYDCLNWMRDVPSWLSHVVKMPVWLLALGIIVVAAVPIGIQLLVLWLSERKVSENTEAPSPRQFTPEDYTQAEVLGVHWQWSYRSHYIHHPQAFCPNSACGCRLDAIEDYARATGYHLAVPVSLVCPHCGFRQAYEWQEEELRRRVELEIERRLRTGQFRQELATRNAKT
jgi:hypothetical protein